MDEKIRQTDGIPTSSGYVKQYIDSLQNEKTSEESLPCPIPGCQFFVSQSEWDDHIALHELQEEMVQKYIAISVHSLYHSE